MISTMNRVQLRHPRTPDWIVKPQTTVVIRKLFDGVLKKQPLEERDVWIAFHTSDPQCTELEIAIFHVPVMRGAIDERLNERLQNWVTDFCAEALGQKTCNPYIDVFAGEVMSWGANPGPVIAQHGQMAYALDMTATIGRLSNHEMLTLASHPEIAYLAAP